MNPEIQIALRVLNNAVVADPAAVSALIALRVSCNAELASHPTIQVANSGDEFSVGILGILNGVLEPFTGSKIAVQLDGGVVIGFQEYVVPKASNE